MDDTSAQLKEIAKPIEVTLDGATVALPAGRQSLRAIRAYLEATALASQRILEELVVDGCAMDLGLPLVPNHFQHIEATTAALSELPLVLLTTAGQQARRARAAVEAALTLVLINPPDKARELWWELASQLKEPVLTLSLMPGDLCQLRCGTTFCQLRRWQLERVATIVCRVDEICESQDNIHLSDALERQVLPWLDCLAEHIQLWQATTQAGLRLRLERGQA